MCENDLPLLSASDFFKNIFNYLFLGTAALADDWVEHLGDCHDGDGDGDGNGDGDGDCDGDGDGDGHGGDDFNDDG